MKTVFVLIFMALQPDGSKIEVKYTTRDTLEQCQKDMHAIAYAQVRDFGGNMGGMKSLLMPKLVEEHKKNFECRAVQEN